MTPFQHPWCNDVLKAPKGDTECGDLHISRMDNAVMSFWKPSPEELANLVVGGSVGLLVESETHPPVSIVTMTREGERRKAETNEEIKAIYEANVARCSALLSITKRAMAALSQATGNKHDDLANEFLDLISLNTGESEAVRELPNHQPEPPTA